jgi:hypothetical protein
MEDAGDRGVALLDRHGGATAGSGGRCIRPRWQVAIEPHLGRPASQARPGPGQRGSSRARETIGVIQRGWCDRSRSFAGMSLAELGRRRGNMKIRWSGLVMTLVLAMAVNGCATEPGEVAPSSEVDDSGATLGTASSELIQPFCFTCSLDPSIRSCSSIASTALWRCTRACVVCDDFGDNTGECFTGSCEPN